MSTTYEHIPGAFHLQLRIGGHATPENIDLFHAILARIDSEWPWRHFRSTHVAVCDSCLGVVFNNPRIAPCDIKSAGRQAGLKVKIYKYSPAHKCNPSPGHTPVIKIIDQSDATLFYRYRTSRLRLEGCKVILLTEHEASRAAKLARVKTRILGPVGLNGQPAYTLVN